MQEFDFTKATTKDVPLIVETIRALRRLSKTSLMCTTRTQSAILRTVPLVVLAAVALELSKPDAADAGIRAGVR
jgi:hypothetical protein